MICSLTAHLWDSLFGLAVAIGLLTFLGGSLLRGTLFAGVRVDGNGLRVCHPLGLGRTYGWDEVTDVAVDDRGIRIRTRRRERRYRGALNDWTQLADKCRRALGRDAEAGNGNGPTVPAEEVARWLGVTIDGEVVCRSPMHRLMPAMWLPTVLLALNVCRDPSDRGSWSLFILCMAGTFLIWSMYSHASGRRGARIREVRATPAEVNVRTDTGLRKCAWGDIRCLHRRGTFWIAGTIKGDLWLPPDLSNRDALLSAIRQAVDARQRGFALPRMTADIPDAALSRAASAEVSTDRGLSRADDDPREAGA